MRRIYLSIIIKHFKEYEQMLFLIGPRHVGKTTLAQLSRDFFKESEYFNWDNVKDRTLILRGQNFIDDILSINKLRNEKPLIIFDEIHKYKDWKNWLKGFFDTYKSYFHILVTGSARLDIYQSGGDSLMGRYFLCRIHPISVGEILHKDPNENLIHSPKEIKNEDFNLFRVLFPAACGV